MLNTSLRRVTSRGFGQWRRRAPTMECGAYASANTVRTWLTGTNATYDRSAATRVADWGARLNATLSKFMIISSSTYCLNAFLLTTMFTLQRCSCTHGRSKPPHGSQPTLHKHTCRQKLSRYISIQSIYDSTVHTHVVISVCIWRAFHGVCRHTYITDTYLSQFIHRDISVNRPRRWFCGVNLHLHSFNPTITARIKIRWNELNIIFISFFWRTLLTQNKYLSV